jgi:cysteinyl-tRNA synthetase
MGVAVRDERDGAAWEPNPGAEEAEVATRAVELLLQLRADARAERDWESADDVREGLERVGVVVKDSQAGTQWEWSSCGTSEE